ncbi:hypothetical protein ACVWZF_000293 [Thermostichus sp. OS-CIW-30]
MESCTDRRSGEGLYSSLKPNKSKNFRARLRDTNGKKSFFHVVRIAAKQRPLYLVAIKADPLLSRAKQAELQRGSLEMVQLFAARFVFFALGGVL